MPPFLHLTKLSIAYRPLIIFTYRQKNKYYLIDTWLLDPFYSFFKLGFLDGNRGCNYSGLSCSLRVSLPTVCENPIMLFGVQKLALDDLGAQGEPCTSVLNSTPFFRFCADFTNALWYGQSLNGCEMELSSYQKI